MIPLVWLRTCVVLVFALLPLATYAHHPLDGVPMVRFEHGFLSGLVHPLLAWDHMLFAMAVGVLVSFMSTSVRLVLPAVYAMGHMIGCVLVAVAPVHFVNTEANTAGVFGIEGLVLLSLFVLGVLFLFRFKPRLPLLVMCIVGFAVVHGSALGAALISTESQAPFLVFFGYVLGLGIGQYALVVVVQQSVLYAARFFEQRAGGYRGTDTTSPSETNIMRYCLRALGVVMVALSVQHLMLLL